MRNHINTTDVFGNTVSCSVDHWNNHVASGHHSIIKYNKDAIVDTLSSPEVVYNSSDFEERKVFFKKSSLSSYDSNRFYTKVIVGYNTSDKGEIVTAFPAPQIKGGIGDVIYTQPNKL